MKTSLEELTQKAPESPSAPKEGDRVNPSGECNSYAVWKDGDSVFCTETRNHEGAHRVEGGGPGAWWMVEIYKVDF